MGKIKQVSVKPKSYKMAEIIAERKKAGDPLKRSRSFRASLRFIGNKLLNQKSNDACMIKVKSLSNITDFKNKKDFKRSISHDDSYLHTLPNVFIREPLKTSVKTETDKKNRLQNKNKLIITTPPPVIAPKAAQILKIPIKENLEPVSLQCELFLRNKNEFVSENSEETDGTDFVNNEYRNGFQRNTFRLSLAPLKKKNFRNLAAIECPSRYYKEIKV